MQRHVTAIGRLVPAWRVLLRPLGLLISCARPQRAAGPADRRSASSMEGDPVG
jgi:hypothetical protein